MKRAFKTEKEFHKTLRELRKIPNVIGIDEDLRPRIKKGKEYPNLQTIRIYVSKKIPIKEIEFHSTIFHKIKRIFFENPILTKNELIPSVINGHPTDVVVIGKVQALSIIDKLMQSLPNNRKRTRPLLGGISSMHYRGSACTISGFFKDKRLINPTKKVLVSSCNHCYSLENKAVIGDPILQPSPVDFGKYPKDMIAKFYKGVEIKFESFSCPFRELFFKFKKAFTGTGINRVDISFGILEENIDWRPEATYIGQYKGKRLPNIGESVQKTGRSTEHTINGKAASVSYTGIIRYNRGSALFTDCILVEGKGFSAPGDSGSPVFDMKGNLIGILFAGSDSHAVICKISNIELEGEVELIIGA